MMVVFVAEVFLVVMLLYIVILCLSLSAGKNENMVSSYECGFDPNIGSRLGFSYRFFLISILFLIFDVEVSLLLPFLYMSMEKWVMIGVGMFLFILMVGLVYEYWNGVLDWVE